MEATNRERWKSVNGYANYEISSCGRIRNATTERMLKPSDSGYQVINLRKNGKSKTHYVHRLVAEAFVDNPTEKRTVDHIDSDRRNNCLSNLRFASVAENSRTTKKRSDCSSLYKGVCWYEPYKKWYARCMVDRKRKHLGYFESEREAGEAYNRAAVDLHKEFARLNIFED